MKNRTVLITGATGIMGSWVLGEALDRGYRPIAIMRDPDPQHAQKRLAAVLNLIGRPGHLDAVRILTGDTQKPDLGLAPDVVAELRARLGGMIHCAACTSFNPRDDAELWATNVGGVANVLHFLSGCEIPLYHVSTAYVVGKRKGCAHESELDLNQEFHNTYERSKCESERLVRAAVVKGSVRAAIFRPGILVGASNDGRITQFLNFYQFLRFLDFASTVGARRRERLRVKANPFATKNLVPADWSAKALWEIIDGEGPSGETYHLTNPNPVTHKSLQEWAATCLGNDVQIEFGERLEGRLSRLELAANSSFRLYRGYMQYEPVFDCANTQRALNGALHFPKLGPNFYMSLLDFARKQNWQGIFGCRTTKGSQLADAGAPAEKQQAAI